MRFLAPLVLLAPLLLGCPNTDPAIFVVSTISAPSLTLSNGVFPAIASGGFTLDLHLGARASGPSTVKLGSFSIVDAQEQGSIVPSLLEMPGSNFATNTATVQPDTDVITMFTIPTQQLPTGAMNPIPQLCASAGVIIEGNIDDSLQGRSVPVYSGNFHPSGCP